MFRPVSRLRARVFSFFIILYTFTMENSPNSDEILSPEQARQWLEDFLQEQQDESE